MSWFKALIQATIDDDLRDMDADQVEEILKDMKPEEAEPFLGRLGHIRAKDIYDQAEE